MPDEPTPRHDDAADADVRDELPEDLDPTAFVGPYVFPNNSRRRVPGVLYLLIAAGLVAVYVLAGDSPLVNGGFLLAALLLGVVGAYALVSGWDLKVDERDALVAATAEAGFSVGHASAQMGWRGLLSRPTWRILLYSAENPPARRGLVLVDGVDARIVDRIIEDNPEDWSDLDGDLRVGDMVSGVAAKDDAALGDGATSDDPAPGDGAALGDGAAPGNDAAVNGAASHLEADEPDGR
ncbi:MAG: hypothetical protein GEV08_03020 [Acidimicrobiia bacterium]|nr:hypothetical protein [Acidimicrobiia bacterium]